ncbi:MAG: VWA domain-containing protein [Flavihumibacter sp.]
MYRFENSWLLVLLAVIPAVTLLFLFVLRWKKKVRAKMGDKRLIEQLTRSFSRVKFLWKFLLVVMAFGLLALAAANPQQRGKAAPQQKKGLDVMILLDVSKSMLAQDIKPNRLERAKYLVNLLLDELGDNRIGLIWFAGRAYMQMPLTTDFGAAKMYLQNAGPDAVPTQGTVTGEALRLAGAGFNSKEKKYKAVILVSDGEDHDPEAPKVAQQLAASGVMINTVGVGSPEGATIFDPETNDTKRDAQGNTVISKLNEEELRELAATGNGIYVYLQDAGAAATSLRNQLATIEKKDLEDDSSIEYSTYYYYLAGAAFLLLLLELFVSERKKTEAVI